jgi:hypothetical protein
MKPAIRRGKEPRLQSKRLSEKENKIGALKFKKQNRIVNYIFIQHILCSSFTRRCLDCTEPVAVTGADPVLIHLVMSRIDLWCQL